jgi:hypothetical protein
MDAPILSESVFFSERLNLDYPGLGRVRAAVERNDLEAAKREFVAHLKHRTVPRWHVDWEARPKEPDPSFNATIADRYAKNELLSVGVWHAFGDTIDWTINPTPNGYAEWTWQLSRHSAWVTLGRAYWATGDERYARAFVFQMNSWTTQNPVPEDSGNERGSRWRTIETGIRAASTWLEAFYLFLGSPTFDDDSVVRMVRSFVEHAEHLIKWPTTGSWLTMEMNGLYHVGVMFPEFRDAPVWRETALNRLCAELDNQVYPDGAQIELSSGYHQVSLSNFVAPLRLARLNNEPIPEAYLPRLEKMYDYNLYAAMPNGRLPALNDGDWTNIRRYCAEGYEFFPNRRDFEWMATDGTAGTRPSRGSFLFPYAGHFVMRSGWEPDALYLLFDGGPFGYGHQHEDKLHFVLYAHGRVHVTDPGNYHYDSSQWRRYHIGAWAHNTILVDGLPQNRRGYDRRLYIATKPIRSGWRTTPSFDYAVASYNEPNANLPIVEGYGPDRLTTVTHRRHIVFVKPEYWVVFDVLIPTDDAEHEYESPFHLDADGVDVHPTTGVVKTTNAEGPNLTIVPLWFDGMSVEVIAGQEHPVVQGWIREGEYGVRPIPTPTFRQTRSGTTTFTYVFFPTDVDAECPIETVEAWSPSGDMRGVRIRLGDGRAHLVAVADDPNVEPIVREDTGY